MSAFHYLGLKVTIALVMIFLPCMTIGGMIYLCFLLKLVAYKLKNGCHQQSRKK